ncbi:flagellin [Aliidiomarina maris]|uniref:Flagellin n=1 Tax=Aliidiomarina maris TaxID=531312 RepID=A0A327X2W3_9GAMM|nr:flagellin [Aliidiomarina maris]RAK00738.1 flagellin [Aliidiomarina maris]RUO27262.1 flagellin FliC [Aliidiomarina maris]
MSLYVNTNVSSLNAQRQLMTSGNGLNTAFERLSSGFRINSASDDAAGLQITNRQTSQINGLNQAVRNANDGISLAQVAEGALQETGNMLQRMRELVVQADNGINEAEDLTAIQEEITQLQAEIDRVAGTTEFSGKNVLDGSLDVGFLVGSRGTANERISVTLSAGTAASGAFSSEGLGVNASAIDVTNLGSGANPAEAALTAIDAAIQTVGSKRAELGAIQNRFQSTIANLSNVVENVSSARSRIQDTDFAREAANLTKFQITQQASTAILAQANQRPTAALSLL